MIKNSTILGLVVASLAACHHAPPSPTTYQGLVEFDERALAFDVAGRIRAIRVARGDMVRAGDLVATLDDSLERPTRAVRAADVDSARAQLALLRAGARSEDIRAAAQQLSATRASEDVVERSLERQRSLIANGAMPPGSVDEIESQADQLRGQRDVQVQRLAELRRGSRPEEISQASARVEAATAALAALDVRLEHYALEAPIAGVVLDVPMRSGEIVSPGTPVASLGDIDHPYVDVFVPQEHIGVVRLGGAAHVRIDAVRAPLDGVVEHIAERTEFTPRFLFSDRERSNLVVRVRVRVLDPSHQLRAGVPAFVGFGEAAP